MLYINNILTSDQQGSAECLKDILNILTDDGENPSGVSYNEKHRITTASFDIPDLYTGKTEVRILFTLKVYSDHSEVIQFDAVLPNEHIADISFDSPEEEGKGLYEDIFWNVSNEDDKRAYAAPVNRQILDYEFSGDQKVSLSGFPYGDFLFAKDMETINKVFGFKPQVYPWQEAAGFGSEPLSIGFDENFAGMGMMIGEIRGYRKVHLRFHQREYEALILDTKTGFGEMPMILPVKYEEEVRDAKYFRMNVDLNADFSCGNRNYYGKGY